MSSETREPAIYVVETYDEKERAERAMHDYARRLRRTRKVGRYGVFIEPRAGVWYLCLVDRGA